MKYRKAAAVLPKELLTEIQNYIQGECLYIPKIQARRKAWGECSGTRKYLNERNAEIRRLFAEGYGIETLSDFFCLSPDSIKKIVYSK